MRIEIGHYGIAGGRNVPCLSLGISSWDDYGCKTSFPADYYDSNGDCHSLGIVKIAGDASDDGRTVFTNTVMDSLPDGYYSLGQSDNYYTSIIELGMDLAVEIFDAMNDVAYNLDLYRNHASERVMTDSLLRFVSRATVENQFHRIATGGAEQTCYNFSFLSKPDRYQDDEIEYVFRVDPQALPSNNIHAIIGENGVGKTHLLLSMYRSFIEDTGEFRFTENDVLGGNQEKLTNVIFVSFSAFDKDETIVGGSEVDSCYIGLKKKDEEGNIINKSNDDLIEEFCVLAIRCFEMRSITLWKRFVKYLEADVTFADSGVTGLFDEMNSGDLATKARVIFSRLSSGHKIVLLTLTNMIARVFEKTLVIMDEPELHLHPPLIAAFIQSISEILHLRNGVGIIATHSPVILQEIPRDCVYMMRRRGRELVVERPNVETYGENVGELTYKVFHHEIMKTGHYYELTKQVDDNYTYDEILEKYSGKLGMEAKIILKTIIRERHKEN